MRYATHGGTLPCYIDRVSSNRAIFLSGGGAWWPNALHWLHNERCGVWIIGASMIDGFSSKRARDTENVSIWWRHHDVSVHARKSKYVIYTGMRTPLHWQSLANLKVYCLHFLVTFTCTLMLPSKFWCQFTVTLISKPFVVSPFYRHPIFLWWCLRNWFTPTITKHSNFMGVDFFANFKSNTTFKNKSGLFIGARFYHILSLYEQIPTRQYNHYIRVTCHFI